MATSAKIFRINYKSDFILTLESDAGWMTPFCIKFWTGSPMLAYYASFDGETYTHCAFDPSEPTKLTVQFDDHHLPIGDLKFQVAYHFTIADFPDDTEDEVINPASITTEIDGETYQVMLDFTGETAPEIQFALPAYANEAQRIANEQQRIAAETQRIANEDTRIQHEEARIAAEQTRQQNEQQRINQEQARVNEYASLKADAVAATGAANDAAALANQKAQLAADKAALAQAAADLANTKAQLAADKASLADAAATLANQKAALAQQKAEYAQTQGGYAKDQGDYAKDQGDYAKAQGDYAKEQGDYAKAKGDYAKDQGDYAKEQGDYAKDKGDICAADHLIAVADHQTAAADHQTAQSDHTTAGNDHTQAGNDHTRAESDHTRAESDHAAVEVYVDSLGVFDLSKHNAVGGILATYADLSAALTALNALESKYKYGGMSFKFVLSSDNNYVQYRLMSDTFNTTLANWQSLNADDEPTAGSDNLVKSGGTYEGDNKSMQYSDSFELTYKNIDFPNKGYIRVNGRFQSDNSAQCTNRIYLFDNVTKIHYKGHLDGTALVVAFYNENNELLPSISIAGNGSTQSGVLTIDDTYVEAKYCIISSYGQTSNSGAAVEYNILITREEIYDNIASDEVKLSLEQNYYIRLNGTKNVTSYARSTELLLKRALPQKIQYSLAIDGSGYIIAFFDENGQILSNISIPGDSSQTQQQGTIDFSDGVYDDVVYVIFSTLTGRLSQSFVKADETELYNKIEEISAQVSSKIVKEVVENTELEQKYTFDNSGCILYKNGGIYSGGGYHTDNIPITSLITNITVIQTGIDSSGAVIAFYDIKNNYLKDISVSGAAGTTVSLDITDEILNKAAYFIASTIRKTSATYCLVTTLSIPKPFLYGKHFCALGDSITDGDGNASYSWYDMLLKRYNAVVGSLNYGISGSCLRAMADFCTAENMANIDICFVMGGTNQLSNYRLGTINDDPTPDKWEKNTVYAVGDRVTGGTRQTSGTSNWSYLYWYECIGAGTSGNTDFADGFPTTTDETFTDGTVTWKCIGNPSWYSDMKRICTKVWGYNPKIQIIWMIPIKRKSDVGKTPEQYTYAEKFNAIRHFCEFNSIRIIDLQKEFPLNEYTQNAIMADNLHPNDNGYKIIQDIVCSHIE